MEAGRMITCIMTSDSSSKKPVIMVVIIRPFRFLFCRSWQAASKLPRSQQGKIAAVLEAFVQTARLGGNKKGEKDPSRRILWRMEQNEKLPAAQQALRFRCLTHVSLSFSSTENHFILSF
jgi:hypothetical protein